MAQVINTNVAALFTGQALYKSANGLQTAMARLSSGLRINTAMDDATGLTTATDYNSKVRGSNVAARSAADGISEAQNNDGLMGQIIENLQRLREIAVQLGGTAAGTETTALLAENSRLAALTTAATAKVIASDGTTLTGAGTTLTALVGVTVADIDTDITTAITARATHGADMSRFTSIVSTLQLQAVNYAASFSRIMDTDYATETQSLTRNQILQQAGTAMLAQANQIPSTVLTLLR
jgi:flagellin